MCGRFAQSVSVETLAKIFGVQGELPYTARPSWNVAPGQPALVVRRNPQTGARHLDPLVWGLVPHWTTDFAKARRPINARGETVATSPMFRSAFEKRRCLIPADAWYEWKIVGNAKQPFAFGGIDRAPLALAGLWESWTAEGTGKVLRTFTILTTEANSLARQVHNRMPIIMPKDQWPGWLGEQPSNPADMLGGYPADQLDAWAVDKAVGNVRNNGPELVRPV